MKKSLILGIILSLTILLFVACGNSETANNEPAPVAEAEEQASEEAVAEEEQAAEEEATEEEVAEEEGVVDTMVWDITQIEDKAPVFDKEAYVAYMLENTNEKEEYLRMRWDRLQADNFYHPENTERVQRAFLLTPREDFIREWNLDQVYDHTALAIEDGQTIAGPHLVMRMTNNIDPEPDMRVLEIGTGSGYQSAVLSNITNYVYTIEIKPNLYSITDEIYKSLEDEYPQYKNVVRKNADGYYGWEEYAPFDRILVTAGIDHIPPALLKQLAPGGIMIIPIGPMTGEQVILKITKNVDEEGNITLEREDIYGGKVTQAFVPFTATDGSWHTQGSN